MVRKHFDDDNRFQYKVWIFLYLTCVAARPEGARMTFAPAAVTWGVRDIFFLANKHIWFFIEKKKKSKQKSKQKK
jgi:hypothetical protein